MKNLITVEYEGKTKTYLISHKGRTYVRQSFTDAKELIDNLMKGVNNEEKES
jgi:hypothetical protein